MSDVRHVKENRRAVVFALILLLPLVFLVLALYFARPKANPSENTHSAQATPPPNGRLVLVIVDSLRRQTMDEFMPNLRALAQRSDAVDVDVHTAAGNMSLTCIQTLLEGRESPYVNAIHNFTTPEQSLGGSLPAAAAQAGLNPALIGDGIIFGLYTPFASKSVNVNSWDLPVLECDLRAIDEAIKWLHDPKIRVLVLHLPGTDAVAHTWHPGHPKYARHYRAVDAKLTELFAQLDSTKDYLVVTGDHGHNEIGAHVPHSLAIFTGGLFPELFQRIGHLQELQQVDLLFFFAFAENLPLPSHYEGSYFGLQHPIDLNGAIPAFRTRLETFANVQKTVLAHAGFDRSTLADSIAAKNAQVSSADVRACKQILPLLAFFIAWLGFAFHINDQPNRSMWPLVALAALALPIYLFSSASLGIALGSLIAVLAMIVAWRLGECRRLLALFALAIGAAITAYMAESWRAIFFDHIFRFIGMLLGGAAVLVFVRRRDLYAWPAAIGSICLFIVPSGPYQGLSGPNLLRGFLIGYAIVGIWLVLSKSLTRIKFSRREWIAFVAFGLTIAVFLLQRSHGWTWHSFVLDMFKSTTGAKLGAFFFSCCAIYLIWIMRERAARLAIAVIAVALVGYCWWFAELPFYALATASAVPVFLASYLVITNRPTPLHDESPDAEERLGLLLMATLLWTFWILFQGFFVQDIDFAFGLKHVDTRASEGVLFLLVYPLTILKYGLPLFLVLFVFVALRGLVNLHRVVIAALIFCNFKLATLIVQVYFGPLRSSQKLYELEMSDAVFVSQLLIILTSSYVAFIAGASFVRKIFATKPTFIEVGIAPRVAD